MSKNIIVKNSLYVTSILAAIVLIITIVFWNQMPMTQRLIGIFFPIIAAHEWEEMRFPGGFVETVIKLTGMPVRDMVIPKFCLFLITLYMLLIPFCIPSVHWLVIGPLVLGMIEPIAHLIVAKVNTQNKFYSPGTFTALLFMIPFDIYTIYYLATQEIIVWTYWLIAALLLIVPLFMVQRFIVVRLMKMNYLEFIKNARDTILKKA